MDNETALSFKLPTLELHNKYEVKVYDKDGNLKQEAVAYNVANSERQMNQCNGVQRTGGSAGENQYLHLGQDDSDKVPHKDDFEVFNYITCYKISFTLIERNREQLKTTQKGTILLSNADGTKHFNEIGLGKRDQKLTWNQDSENNRHYGLISHAKFYDSEGHDIIIDKTTDDSIEINVFLQFTGHLITTELLNGFRQFPKGRLALLGIQYGHTSNNDCNAFASSSYGISWNINTSKGHAPGVGGSSLTLSTISLQPSSDSMFWDNAIPSSSGTNQEMGRNGQNGILSVTNFDSLPVYNIFPKVYSLNNKSIDYNYICGMIHSITLSGIGGISLPNENIFPPQTISNIILGTGNGTNNQFFDSEIDEITSVIVKDGNTILSSNQYTWENFDITKSPLQNKCQRIVKQSSDNLTNTQSLIRYIHKPEEENLYVDNCSYQLDLSTGRYGPITYFTPFMSNQSIIGYGDSTAGMSASGIQNNTSYNVGYSQCVYYDNGNLIKLNHLRLGGCFKSTYDIRFEYSMDNDNWISVYKTSSQANPQTIWFNEVAAPYWRLYFQDPGRQSSYFGCYVHKATKDAIEAHPTYNSSNQQSKLRFTTDIKQIVAGYYNPDAETEEERGFDFEHCGGVYFNKGYNPTEVVTISPTINLPFLSVNNRLIINAETSFDVDDTPTWE